MECSELDVVTFNDERWIVIKTFCKSTGEQTVIDGINGSGVIRHIRVGDIQDNLGFIDLNLIARHEGL